MPFVTCLASSGALDLDAYPGSQAPSAYGYVAIGRIRNLT